MDINGTAFKEPGKDLLRFLTCGSVDDGKSTLIGRLLHDSKLVFEDQLMTLARDSARHGTTGDDLDFALLVDGLEAEREQGITIDVAYRFFTTPRRSFIVADTPGHEQYTRNMATGASRADLAVILIDARKGISAQTRRHLLICSMLGIRHIIAAINKIDLISYDEEQFEAIAREFRALTTGLGFLSVFPIPISARRGDNVATTSAETDWYKGPSLLEYLETIDIERSERNERFRFPVQLVVRPNLDFRGYAGTVVAGNISPGDPIVVGRSGKSSTVKEILTHAGRQSSASTGDAITITLADDIDVGRGDLLCSPDSPPEISDQFAAEIIWMSEKALMPGRSYLARIGTNTTPITITTIKHKIDVNTRDRLAATTLELNDIGFCNLATSTEIAFDRYAENRKTGSFILIDRFTNHTVGAGMIAFPLRRGANTRWQPLLIGKLDRAAIKHQRAAIVWFTGLSGAGKSAIANIVEQRLHAAGHHTMLLDGDNIRHGLNRDLGFAEADRVENIRRVGEIAKLMVEGGLIVLCSLISPYRAERETVRSLVEDNEFLEVFVDTPIEECMRRDPKGLYAKVKAGTIKNFTGFDAPYEAPDRPEIHLSTTDRDPQQLAEEVVTRLVERKIARL